MRGWGRRVEGSRTFCVSKIPSKSLWITCTEALFARGSLWSFGMFKQVVGEEEEKQVGTRNRKAHFLLPLLMVRLVHRKA